MLWHVQQELEGEEGADHRAAAERHFAAFHVLATKQHAERIAQLLVEISVHATGHLEKDDPEEVGALRTSEDAAVCIALSLRAMPLYEPESVFISKEAEYSYSGLASSHEWM